MAKWNGPNYDRVTAQFPLSSLESGGWSGAGLEGVAGRIRPTGRQLDNPVLVCSPQKLLDRSLTSFYTM